jgi:hypothetical protein
MSAGTPKIPWVSIVVSGVAAFVMAFAATFLVVTAYAIILAVQAQGAPNPDQINAFANQVAPYLGPALLTLFVAGAAYFVGRRAQVPQIWYGVLIGIIAALLSAVFAGVASVVDIVGLVVAVAGGVLGAYLAMRQQSEAVPAT